MSRTTASIGALLIVATSVVAQQPPPQQTTTSVNRGDQNTAISATATSQQTPGTGVREPATPRAPFAGAQQARPAGTTRTRTDADRAPAYSPEQRAAMSQNSDVYLEVPNLSVEQILLDVQNLRVHLDLDANVVNLVSLRAGADARIGRVKLEIRGVEAEAYLVVRLDNVAKILDRTLATIDRNPELLTKLLSTVDRTVGTVGGVANTALQPGGVVSQTVGTLGQTLNNVTAPNGLLTQTVNRLGQTVQRTLDTTGGIVERTLDTTGKVVNSRTVGKLLDLQVLNETTNAAGQVVKTVRDTTGATIEYTLDNAGKIINSRVVTQGPGR